MTFSPSSLVRPLVVAALVVGAAAPAAQAEIRNGSTGAGLKKPADPSLRIVRASVSYDTAGVLTGTVTAAGPVQDRTVGVIFLAGTYNKRRVCKWSTERPRGALGGEIDTFSLPPVPDEAHYGLEAIRMAWLGDDALGDDGVSYSAVGPTATLTGTNGLFADRPWNCAYAQLYNTQDTAAFDDTLYFPLGRKAIAENRRLQRRALKRCGKRAKKAARSGCRRKARERYPY